MVTMREPADAAADGAPGVRTVIAAPRLGRELRRLPRDVWGDEVVARGNGADDTLADTAAEDPYMIIYTSGTTGRPNGAVDVHGGFPVQAAQELAPPVDPQP